MSEASQPQVRSWRVDREILLRAQLSDFSRGAGDPTSRWGADGSFTRAAHTPDWRMDALFTTFIPRLIEGGVSQSAIDRMLIDNPRRLLEVEG